MSTDRIAEWTARKFEGLNRTELKEAAEVLGLNFGPNTSERVMRVKLCEKVGTMPASDNTHESTPVAPRASGNLPFDPKPNLTAQGEWGGRKHIVYVFPQSNQESDQPQGYFRLFHECEPRDFPFGQDIILSEPYYNSLKNAETGVVKEREIRDNSGNLVRIEHYEVKSPRYPFQYKGVVPGTENLPGSLKEYWKMQAAKTNNFAGISRRHLIAIRADLYGPVGPGFYKDLTDQDILASILSFLGVDEFA